MIEAGHLLHRDAHVHSTFSDGAASRRTSSNA